MTHSTLGFDFQAMFLKNWFSGFSTGFTGFLDFTGFLGFTGLAGIGFISFPGSLAGNEELGKEKEKKKKCITP